MLSKTRSGRLSKASSCFVSSGAVVVVSGVIGMPVSDDAVGDSAGGTCTPVNAVIDGTDTGIKIFLFLPEAGTPNPSLNALVLFEILKEFLQQRSFKIHEVNFWLKYLLIVANICPTTRGGNGWTEGSTCKFPFNYRGQMYGRCITLGENAPWCYTVDKPTRTTYGVPWGYCTGDFCPQGNSHFKSSWSKNLTYNLYVEATNEISIKKQSKIKFIQIHHMVFKDMKM